MIIKIKVNKSYFRLINKLCWVYSKVPEHLKCHMINRIDKNVICNELYVNRLEKEIGVRYGSRIVYRIDHNDHVLFLDKTLEDLFGIDVVNEVMTS